MIQALRIGESSTDFPLNGNLQRLGTFDTVYSFAANSSDHNIEIMLRMADPPISGLSPVAEKKVLDLAQELAFSGTELEAMLEIIGVDDNPTVHNIAPYVIDWAVKLAKASTSGSSLCQIEHQSIILTSTHHSIDNTFVQEKLVSDPDGGTGESSAVLPIFTSLRKKESIMELSIIDRYSALWWTTLVGYLSLVRADLKTKTSNLENAIKELQTMFDNATSTKAQGSGIWPLTKFVMRDLNDARPYLSLGQPSIPTSESYLSTDNWSFDTWLLERFKSSYFEIWPKELVESGESLPTVRDHDINESQEWFHLALLTLMYGITDLQASIRREIGNDPWWHQLIRVTPDVSVYHRTGQGDWNAIGIIHGVLTDFHPKVSRIGPVRRSPDAERLAHPGPRDDLGANGEHTAAVLQARRDKEIVVPLPDGYEKKVTLGEALNRWLGWFGLADDVIARDRGRFGIDVEVIPPRTSVPVELASVGVGVSQVLPVITMCLLSEPADLLILEQPELHLHPALQKRMADFLLVFVRAGRQILVETHSDHLVNQLRFQVAADESDEIKDLVKLIFAEQKDGITTYRESEINEYGGLSEDWPDGFLDVSAKSAQDLVRHGLRKWKLRQPRPGETS